MEDSERRLKCKYCEYSVPPEVTAGNGKVQLGADMIAAHVRDTHREQRAKERPHGVWHGNAARTDSTAHARDNSDGPIPLDQLFREE